MAKRQGWKKTVDNNNSIQFEYYYKKNNGYFGIASTVVAVRKNITTRSRVDTGKLQNFGHKVFANVDTPTGNFGKFEIFYLPFNVRGGGNRQTKGFVVTKSDARKELTKLMRTHPNG